MANTSSRGSFIREIQKLEKKLAQRDQEIADLQHTNERLGQELAACISSERNLKSREKLLQTLLDTIDGEAFIKATNGVYIFVNRAYGNNFGVDPQEVIGRDDFFVFSPDTAKELQENDRRIMAAGKSENVEESTVLNGKFITYLTNKVPLMGDDGSVVGICGVGFDITRQKQLEKELQKARQDLEQKVRKRTAQLTEAVAKLRKAEMHYRTVADFTYDWEYWVNLDGSVNYVSPSCERISGYTPRQFTENPILFKTIIVEEDQDLWRRHYHDSRMDPQGSTIQFRIKCRDGSLRWIEHVCQPIIGNRGEMLGFRASNRDVTNRKEKELDLQKAYVEIEELKARLEAEQTYLREEIKQEHDYEHIIGDSDEMQYVLFRANQVADTNTTVLIQGETGTGKELIARAIHNASRRRRRPLIKVDCASLPASLIESELFGHAKGAFTNALETRVGRFELANGATIFLDEIGELPLDLQPKLLRVLQDGEFEKVGSSKTQNTDVRVIAATNRDLEADVKNKKFRMDLWYRLNVFAITVPPLRERGRDIELIAGHMVKFLSRKLGKEIKTIPAQVIDQLLSYPWPGNVRELENVIERGMINSRGDMLQLDESLDKQQPPDRPAPDKHIQSLREVEKKHILRALRKCNWQIHGKNGTAALLDINPSTLRGRMRKHGIRRPPLSTV